MPGLTTRRSTTMSIVCFFCLSSAGQLAARARPSRRRCGRAGSPRAPSARAASCTRPSCRARRARRARAGCPAGSSRTRSTICCTVCGRIVCAAVRAVRHADRGVEQPQVVVDLGHRADRRARVLRHRLLLDRDRRRQAVDRVDVRLLHLLQELPRVGRERLDVAPLPLGEEGVEGERRLARAGDAGDHHELVAGDLEVEVLEVVLARAANRNRIHRNRPL